MPRKYDERKLTMANTKWIMSMPGAKSRMFHKLWPYIPRPRMEHEQTDGCPAIGVGGTHSEYWSESDGPGCEWCGASSPKDGRFVVPFFGTGFDSAFMAKEEGFEIVAGDASELLIGIHKNFERVVSRAELWLSQNHADKITFRALRAVHNENPRPWTLYLLGRLAYGQLIRHNRKGEYNAPFGQLRKLPTAERAREHQAFIESIELWPIGFGRTLAQAKPGDVVYLDPPYLGTFDAYTAYPFNSVAFAHALGTGEKDEHGVPQGLTARGVAWAVSNGPEFEALLRAQPGIRNSELKVESFDRQGTISAGSRAKVSEILITWTP